MAKNRHPNNSFFVLASIDELVPPDHLVRDLQEFIDWDFIYPICDPLYSDIGSARIDPVILFKLMMITVIFGIHSMRKTCQEVQVNVAYRWFLGIPFEEKIPDHSTFSQNYIRKFKDNGVAIQIFMQVIQILKENGVLDLTTVFSDGKHLKANANKNKYTNTDVEIAAKLYHQELEEEIQKDRIEHHKKVLKKKEEKENVKNRKTSKSDPESGYFHKGEKDRCFAYNINTSGDCHGYILGMYVEPGNIHDNHAFFGLYTRLRCWYGEEIENHVVDAGYVSPAICKLILDNKQWMYAPYKRPMTKKGFFKKYEYVYDEYYDCYICPNEKLLEYQTTTREGYRKYVSKSKDCERCPMIGKCTESKNHQKVVMQHVWEDYKNEVMDEIRHSDKWKEIYPLRKETIERSFADGKRKQGLDYTLYRGREAVEFHTLLIYTGMHIKKYALHRRRLRDKYAQSQGCEHQSKEIEKILEAI